MDGHFVPNLSFGPQTVSDLREKSELFFDVHLMLDNPHLYIDAFAEAGSDLITIHIEPNMITLKRFNEFNHWEKRSVLPLIHLLLLVI